MIVCVNVSIMEWWLSDVLALVCLFLANFHLRNGAIIWRLNWLADRTSRGLTTSCGLMVNYRYLLDKTEDNSRMYVETQNIAVSDQFIEWLKPERGSTRYWAELKFWVLRYWTERCASRYGDELFLNWTELKPWVLRYWTEHSASQYWIKHCASLYCNWNCVSATGIEHECCATELN